ncbi:MAG: hypothetical protein L0216_03105 [Planctomycetales bacterium]|nr:hypothetical protein [Planctomycetales bacterium]
MSRPDLKGWLEDPEGIALRVDSADVGLLRALLGRERLSVPEGVVAWVERPDGSARRARAGDEEEGPFVAVLVKDRRVPVALEAPELRTREDFPAGAALEVHVAVDTVSPEGLRDFSRHLFASGPAFTRRDLALFLGPPVEAALAALSAETPAADLCRGDPSERFERELRGRLRRVLFEGGLELLAVRNASVRCEEWERIRSEKVDAAVEEERERHRRVLREAWVKEQKNQALTRGELADFYRALEHEQVLKRLDWEKEKAARERELASLRAQLDGERSRGELRKVEDFLSVLDRAGVRDVFERYMDLLAGRGRARRRATEAGLPEGLTDGKTRRILAATGPALLAYDPGDPDGSGPRETHDLSGARVGAARSVRLLETPEGPLAVAGAQRGVVLVPLRGGAPRALPFPDGPDGAGGPGGPVGPVVRGGVNAAALAGTSLVATHSEVGVVRWDLSDPRARGERVLAPVTDGARTVRGAQVVGETLYLAVADRVLAYVAAVFPGGTVTAYPAGAPVTALVATRRHVFAGTADGRILRFPVGEPDRGEPELARRESPVTMLRPAFVNGEPSLLVAWAGYGVVAKALDSDVETPFHAESPIRWTDGGSDVIAGVTCEGRALHLWEPSRPKARWKRLASPHRIADLWMWREGASA